jgi:hypothetical protein
MLDITTYFSHAKAAGIQPNPGQEAIFRHWGPTGYLRSFPENGPETITEEPGPKIGFITAGRRSGTTTAAALIITHEATQFVHQWATNDITVIQPPYFIYLVPTKDQCPSVTQLITRIIKTISRPTYGIEDQTPPGIHWNADRDSVTIWHSTQPNKKIHILIRAATGLGTRGMSAKMVVLDNHAFFHDPKDTFQQLLPTIQNPTTAGRILSLSTPHPNPHNYFNQMWHKAHNTPNNPGAMTNNPLTMSIPTWEANPTIGTQDTLKAEYAQWYRVDGDFDIEYGARVPKVPDTNDQ